MKKLALTIAIVLGISLSTIAQEQYGGGLFQYGAVSEEEETSTWFSFTDRGLFDPNTGSLLLPTLPGAFGENDDQNAPLGSGMAVLMGLGAAYLVAKKRKK